jgi:hypothetical protein
MSGAILLEIKWEDSRGNAAYSDARHVDAKLVLACPTQPQKRLPAVIDRGQKWMFRSEPVIHRDNYTFGLCGR